MSNKKENVSVAKPKIGGAIFKAPCDNTKIPSDAKTALDSSFKCCGYVSDDGVVFSTSEKSEDVKSWGNEVVTTLDSDFTDEFEVTYIESMNEEVLKEYHGEGAVKGTIDTGITVDIAPNKQDYKMIVIDMILNKGKVLKRIVIPRCKVSDKSDVTYKDDEVIAYKLKYACATGYDDGTYHKEFISKAEGK